MSALPNCHASSLSIQRIAYGSQVVGDPWFVSIILQPCRVSRKKEAVVTTGAASSPGLKTVLTFPGVKVHDVSCHLLATSQLPWLQSVTLRVRNSK